MAQQAPNVMSLLGMPLPSSQQPIQAPVVTQPFGIVGSLGHGGNVQSAFNPGSSQQVQASAQSASLFEYNSDILEEIVNFNCVALAGDILSALQLFLEYLPKNEAYLQGEVKIRRFKEDDTDLEGYRLIANLIGAGTAILDAVLYVAYGAAETHKGMFDLTGSAVKDSQTGNHYVKVGFSLLTACLEFFFTRGQLPNSSTTNSPLSNNMIKRTLNGLGISEESHLAGLLSSAPLKKFPTEVFNMVGYMSLDKITIARIQLSPAGAKFRRYFVIATPMVKKDVSKDVKEVFQLVLQMNAVDAMAFHPSLSTASPKPPKFTDKMTRIALSAIDPSKRVEFYSYMENKKMTSLLLKESLMKKTVAASGTVSVTFPCLDDQELSPSDINATVIADIINRAKVAYPNLFNLATMTE